jgi:hypothetical protein
MCCAMLGVDGDVPRFGQTYRNEQGKEQPYLLLPWRQPMGLHTVGAGCGGRVARDRLGGGYGFCSPETCSVASSS